MARTVAHHGAAGVGIRRAREASGLSQAALAHAAHISRQALGAIESGRYQPSVTVALALARELGEPVERLFAPGDSPAARVEAHVAGAAAARGAARARVTLARIACRIVAVPSAPAALSLAAAAGIVERIGRSDRAQVETFRSRSEIDGTLMVAGCDPAVTLLADWIARHHAPVTVAALACSSAGALDALGARHAHAAGVHLRDPRSGEYNLAAARRALHRRSTLINFARWELGLATARGNPLGIRGFADVARPALRIVNRALGSGARAALDEALSGLGIAPASLAGYGRELGGHLDVAAAIAAGDADAGVTIRVAADAYALHFITIREERYDLALLNSELGTAPVAALLDALGSSRFAREVAELCGYDTRDMGTVVARIA
jgi:molybdopterin molybdotransferase/putative molybdopterin biosynthesis protein